MKRELALAFGMVRKEKRIVPIVSIVFKPPQAKAVLALDFVACQSKKRANMSKQCVDATHVYRWVL